MWLSEYSHGAIILASANQCNRLDKMQWWFLHEIGITDAEAFTKHNFAPPSLRRRIGILGFLHKRVLHLCHPGLCALLPMSQAPLIHNRTLHSFLGEVVSHHRLYFRSLYGYVNIYNRLSQSIVDSPSVEAFQSKLTHIARHRVVSGDLRWRQAFEDEMDVLFFVYPRPSQLEFTAEVPRTELLPNARGKYKHY